MEIEHSRSETQAAGVVDHNAVKSCKLNRSAFGLECDGELHIIVAERYIAANLFHHIVAVGVGG